MPEDERQRLLAALSAKDAEIALLRAELAAVRGQLDALLGLAANQNQQLSELTEMMRRKLRPAPKPKVDPPEDDPPPGGSAGGAAAGANSDGASLERPPVKAGRKRGQDRRRNGRSQLPGHLPVDEERHDIEQCAHCGSDRLLARDTEVTEKLDIVQSFVRRRRIVRAVAVCACCRETSTARMPPMPCKRAKYTNAFLAWLVVQKFVLLVPLDRIRRMLASQGIDLSEGTLVHLIDRAATLLDAIDGEHWKQLKAGSWLALDGTGLKTRLEWLPTTWLANLDIFNRGELVVYQYSLTKHGDTLAARLQGFEGTIVCDAESRHHELFSTGRAEANCNAHPRRKFRDAEKVQPKLAPEAGRYLTRMYEVERQARAEGKTGAALLAERQAKTRPIVEEFQLWLKKQELALLPSDPLGQAVRYYLKHFKALTRFVSDPDLPIDNNRSERGFQNHAKLRLMSLFAGSPEGGHRWATLLGVVETAQRHGLDVFAYLTWAFDRRGTARSRFGLSASSLTPAAYKKTLEERLAQAAVA